ncbi:MAG TPA: hypothetical protein VIM11_26120 [Tepidisphaeraceae bacterium]|jgi:exonuclease VII small subunit
MRCVSIIGALVLGMTGAICSTGSAADNSATAAAGKQVHSAATAADAARMDLNKIRARIRIQLAVQPQWSATMKELHDAQTAFEEARHAAMAALVKDPNYQHLVSSRDQTQATLSTAANAANQDDTQIQKAGDLMVQQGFEIKRLENQALANDDRYQQTKARLDVARKKADDLDLEAARAMTTDPAYEPAMQRLNTAEQQLQSARQQLAQAAQADRQQRADKLRADAQQAGSGY